MSAKQISYSLAIILFSLVFFATPFLMKDFSTRGEAREAVVVPAMFEQDNFILPLRNGVIIPSKPPMYHWLAAISATVFNSVDEFTIRLPSALLSSIFLGVFFLFICSVSNNRRAFLTVLILGTTTEWLRGSSHARVDIVFTFFLSMACLMFFDAFTRRRKNEPHQLFCFFFAGLFTALAILAKGPSAFILIAAIAGLYFFIDPEINLKSRLLKFPYLSVLFAASIAIMLSAYWYYLAYQVHGQAFLDKQLIQENLARVVEQQGANPGHEKPFFFSLILLLQGFFPWSLLTPLFIFLLHKESKSIFRPDNKFLLYSFVWLFIFVLAVSLSISKRSVYLLPAYPAFAYILAYAIDNQLPDAKSYQKFTLVLLKILKFVLLLVVLILFVLCVVGVNQLPFNLKERDVLLLETLYEDYFVVFCLILLSALLAVQKKYLHTFDKFKYCRNLAFCVLVITLIVNYSILPSVARITSPRNFANEINAIVPKEAKLAQFDDEFYSLVYYAKRPITWCGSKNQASKFDYLVLGAKDLDQLGEYRGQFLEVLKSKELAANGKDHLLLLKHL